MAKFVVLARQTFVDLVRGLKSSARKGNKDIARMLKLYNQQRGKIQRSYAKATGNELPENKIAVPKVLYDRLQSVKTVKKGAERRTASLREIDRSFYEARNKPGGSTLPPALGSKGSSTDFNGSEGLKLPSGSKRMFPKRKQRQIDETLLQDARNYEQDLSIFGRKQGVLKSEDMEEANLRGLLADEPERSRPYTPKYRKRNK
jgi:hypothetical protein